MPHLLPFLPALAYLAAGALTWIGIARAEPRWLRAGWALGASGVAGQAAVMTPAIVGTLHSLALTLTDAAALVGVVVALVTLFTAWRGALRGASVALWLTSALLAMGGSAPGLRAEQAPVGLELLAHILLSALAAGLLSVAAILVLLLAALSGRLRARRPLGVLSSLPPVEALEDAVFRTLLAGFVLLSLSLLSGFLFIQDLFAQHLVHKTVLSIAAWCIFGTLLAGRHRFGWRGRQALRFLLAGYVTLALAYFGSRFVLEGLLGRHWG